MKKIFTLFTLLLCVVSSAWADTKPTISGITLPDAPTSALDLSTQTTYTADTNGWIVFSPKADGITNNTAYWSCNATNGNSRTWSTPSGATAPFLGGSNKTCYALQTGRVHSLRFTGAESFSVLGSSGGTGRYIHVALYTYDGTTFTLVEDKSDNQNKYIEILFKGLNTSTTYVAYFYGNATSNSDLCEVAIKKPVSVVTPDAPTFSPNGGNVDGGTTVTISGTGNIYYQWSDSNTAPTTSSDGWTVGSSATVPNETATKYLYAYASNSAGSSTVASATFNVTKATLAANLSFTKTEYSIYVDATSFDAPTVNNPNNLTGITYTLTGDDGVASVEASTGVVALLGGTGTVTITASTEEQGDYAAGSASYTLTVNEKLTLTTVSDKFWKFSDSAWNNAGTISTTTIIDNMEVLADANNTASISSSGTVTIDNIQFTKYFQFGQVKSGSRQLHIKVAGRSIISVYLKGGSGRKIKVAKNSKGGTVVGTEQDVSSTAAAYVFNYTDSDEGDLYLFNSGSNGLNFYGVKVEPMPAVVTPTITTQPVGAEYALNEAATALTIVAEPLVEGKSLSYQWYSNTTKSTENATLIDGATEASYTPSTATVGTTYYYCVVTEQDNANTITSDIVAIVVSEKYTVSFAAGNSGATTSVLPSPAVYSKNTEITLPTNHYFYLDGNSVSKWSDGTSEYAFGAKYTVTNDVTFYPIFAENTKGLGDEETTITWTFATAQGAPKYSIEGNGKTATVVGTTDNGIDMELDVALTVNPNNSSEYGKFNNTGNSGYAQVNKYSTFIIPAMKGMTVKYTICNGTPNVSDDVFFGEDKATSVSGQNYVYTYTGTETTLTLSDLKGALYPSGISVTYPSLYTAAPTIAAGAFSFENKYYPVTITGAAGTTKIETSTDDGATWEEQTLTDLACTVNVTAGQTLKARATAEGKEPSETVSFTNDFDATKKYVAWVYGTDGNYTQYNPATDKMVIALKEDYNVVAVGSVNTQSPSNDLNNADLIVCSEAMTGNKTFSNGMKVFAGVTPMIGLKAYNYTKGRWNWGTPANPSSTAQSFIPKSKLYKVLKNVSYETDGSIKLATATSGNVIQTVEFGTTDCTAPEGNVIMGTLDNNDEKAVMYASNKYFGLGLSCDCRETYTDNAITIIKNAAAMLIAGELMILEPSDPVAEGDVVTLTTTATMAGWRAFYDADNSYTVDENTKVYVAKNENEGKVTLTEYAAGVPAGTPVILKTSAEAETDGTFKMTLTKTTETITPTYTGESLLKVTPFEGNVYRLGSKSGEVGFFPFNATGAAAGIVVLNVDSSNAGARGLGITFDDETTAIHNVKDNMDVNKNVYDLQGRSVAKPTKGLYIVNGKKVVIK